MIGEDFIKGLFGEKGLAGNVMDVLKSTGILKDPEHELKVNQALMDYEAKIKQQDVDLEKIHADDRKSAREREIAVRDKTPTALAIFAFVGFFGTLIGLMVVDVPEKAHDPLMIMLGLLGAMVGGVVQYYFGSSAGSTAKTAILDRVLKR